MKKLGFILVTLLGVLLLNTLATSFSANSIEAGSGPMMQVAPVIEEFSLDPASQEEKHITVTNQSDQDLSIRVYFTPYSVLKDTSDFESESEYTQIYHWLKVKDDNSDYKDTADFTIQPNSAKNIYYRVNVPESAPGGSQHACLFVETIPGEAESSGITTVSRTAVKIFADVSGKTVKDAEILNLNTDNFVINGKVAATTTVKNIGNIDIKPTLTIEISTLSGETVFSDTKAAMIFPENEANIKVEWPDTPAFGVYHLIAITNILGKNSTIEKTIIILPSWFIILFIVVSVLIIVLLTKFKHKKS